MTKIGGSQRCSFHHLLMRMPMRKTTKSPSISAAMRCGMTLLSFTEEQNRTFPAKFRFARAAALPIFQASRRKA